MENFKQISDIDVVEINQNVIDVTTSLNHLKSSNIIHANAYKHISDKKYDLIIVDIWWDYQNNVIVDSKIFTDILVSTLFNRYAKNLNIGGKVYVPLLDRIINL
jgi:hypothetical protein